MLDLLIEQLKLQALLSALVYSNEPETYSAALRKAGLGEDTHIGEVIDYTLKEYVKLTPDTRTTTKDEYIDITRKLIHEHDNLLVFAVGLEHAIESFGFMLGAVLDELQRRQQAEAQHTAEVPSL